MTFSSNTRWLNRTVLGIGIASFFSDLGHETATSILPMFLATIGAAPAALGIIEGVSDAISSFSKLGSGWYSDRLKSRKPIAVLGYFLTGLSSGVFGLATDWIHVLFGRTFGWFGRGIRGPVRDAIMSDAVTPEATGRAFGFDRSLDTLGAVIGPIVALWLVSFSEFRTIFFLSLIPGILAALSFAFFVRESPHRIVEPRKFSLSLQGLPPEFRKFLVAVGVFGMGDFAHTLLILRATQIFTQQGITNPSQLAVSLYVIHNIVYAAMSYPVGALGDRIGKRAVLVAGYVFSGVMCVGFLIPFPGYSLLAVLFVVGGLYIAIEDSLERAIAADLLPANIRGMGFGVLATVNGIGDFVSSIVMGFLWTSLSSSAGFIYAALLSFAGAVMVLTLKQRIQP